jgi:uncharacterized membrane protein
MHNRYHYYSEYISKRSRLSETFAGIDHDIECIFLSLPRHHLENIFTRYKTEYGVSAEKYARKTYEKWKTKTVRMSGTTAERLLNLVPPFLSTENRFELIKKLRAGHLHPVHLSLVTTPETWRKELFVPIKELVTRSATFSLCNDITDRAAWLADGDIVAAQSLLAAAEQEEAIIRIRYLEAEFKRIEILVANIEQTLSASHRIVLPQGTITVTIALPKKTLVQSTTSFLTPLLYDMNELNSRKQTTASHTAVAKNYQAGSLLDAAMSNLPADQREDLIRKALDRQLDLDAEEMKAQRRFDCSSADMNQILTDIHRLETTTKADYTVRGNYETASGNTTIEVKRNNNTVVIIVAIAAAICMFALFSR